jgi:outer membrane protein assembly factor BamB
MSEPSLATVVGTDMEFIIYKWSTFVDGKDGFLYGIPVNARRVAKFNPLANSMEMIGHDLGGDGWDCGVLAKNGCIYCPPTSQKSRYYSGKMLKINTNDGTVITLDTDKGGWRSGALGADNCVYYMPWGVKNLNHILRVDPHTDTLSYIRVPSARFKGTVLGKDNCIYGVPTWIGDSRDGTVMRFDPMEPENISHFGNDTALNHGFAGGGVLGNDGHIYALSNNGSVLKVDTSARTVSSIGESFDESRFTQPIIGLDQCIYWPPGHTTRVLKFDPTTQQPPSYIGPDTPEIIGSGWIGGALASDGVIYCAPSCASQVLAIDPLRELSMTMNEMMMLYPDELGRLFVPNNETYSESLYESAVRKFGFARALRLLDECLPSDDEWAERHSTFDGLELVKREAASGDRKRKRSSDCVPLFVLAASDGSNVGDVPLIVIYGEKECAWFVGILDLRWSGRILER